MTKLQFVNQVFLQWFFVRLTKHYNDAGKLIKWSFMFWVVPITGWNSDFVFIKGKQKFLILRNFE